MKIRTDFVTNSSSSSYVISRIDNKALADLYIQAGLYWNVSGENNSVVKDRFDDEQTDMNGPYGGSIVDWLKQAIEIDAFGMDKDKYLKLIELLDEHRDEVDYGTRSAEFATVHIVTDGDSNFFHSEERKGGKIIYCGIDESNWDYEKEGYAIFDFINGSPETVRKAAKERGGTVIEKDPWFKAGTDDVFDIIPDDFTFKDKNVCLTGDFAYGAKSKVKALIEEQGGNVVSSVTKKTDIVLAGDKGSSAWAMGNYGTKIEKALKLKGSGSDIKILKEIDVF